MSVYDDFRFTAVLGFISKGDPKKIWTKIAKEVEPSGSSGFYISRRSLLFLSFYYCLHPWFETHASLS